MANGKKLCKKSNGKKLCGVCAGLADYLNIDVTVIRLIYVLISFASASFPGLLVYIIMALILPDENDVQPPYDNY